MYVYCIRVRTHTCQYGSFLVLMSIFKHYACVCVRGSLFWSTTDGSRSSLEAFPPGDGVLSDPSDGDGEGLSGS